MTLMGTSQSLVFLAHPLDFRCRLGIHRVFGRPLPLRIMDFLFARIIAYACIRVSHMEFVLQQIFREQFVPLGVHIPPHLKKFVWIPAYKRNGIGNNEGRLMKMNLEKITQIARESLLASRLITAAVMLLLFPACQFRGPDYSAASEGNSQSALIARAKLDLMYYRNSTPVDKQEDIYLRYPSDLDIPEKSVFKNINEVDRDYIVTVLDFGTTNAIVEVVARNVEASWMGIPKSTTEWILINDSWKIKGVAADDR